MSFDDTNDKKYEALFGGAPGTILGAIKEKLVRSKEKAAQEKRHQSAKEAPPANPYRRPDGKRKLPPGQNVVTKWPVLDLGVHPNVPRNRWQLTVTGAVENPVMWSWADFLALPQSDIVADVHCVTTWSLYDSRWSGIATKDFLAIVKPKPEARFVVFHSHDGYATNVPLARFAEPDALLARSWNGTEIPREHGGPMRIVIPSLYFWKSAKWVRQISFHAEDRPGFWELRGYHNIGDPWKEERYG
jgi:DMSO/TMAO reductase YedYZ molybdopterin-dependent catalytic subunit